MRIARALVVLALLGCADGAPSVGAQERQLEDGTLGSADYLISMPAKWNGGLVMFAHGYEGEGNAPGNVQASPLDFRLTAGGYAWAASGYRSKGYRPDWFLADTLALREHVIQRFGRPRWSIIHGQSMGGHVAIASLELHPEVYQGGLVECGVVEGVGLIDWYYAYTAAAEFFTKAPLLETPDPKFAAVAATVPAALGTPGSYTELGRRFDSVVKHLAGGDLPLRLEGLAPRYLANLGPRDPGPQRAQEFSRHGDTRQVRYDIDPGLGVDAETLNREIPRVSPKAGARSREANPVFAEVTGRISVPVLMLHETADLRVPFRLQQDYRRRTLAAGTSHLLVQRAVRRAAHCGIEADVRDRAFDDLVAWMERGTVPDGDDVLGDPGQLGLRFTPTLDPRDPAGRP